MSPQVASRRAPPEAYNTKTKQKLKINILVSVCTFIFSLKTFTLKAMGNSLERLSDFILIASVF